MSYRPHQSLVAPAKDTADLWRVGLGFCVGVSVYLGLSLFAIATFSTIIDLFDPNGGFATTPGALLLFLGTFMLMIAALELSSRTLHKRAALDYLGLPAFALRDFFRVVLFTLPVALGTSFIASASLEVTLNTAPVLWALLLPVATALLLIQVTAEELVFRGYLQAHLAARFASPLVWMIVPSLLFAYGHYSEDSAGGNAFAIAAWTFVFAVAAADLTARTGTLGAAIGLHFANNFVALLVLSLSGDLSGLSLLTLTLSLEDEAAIRPLLWRDGLILLCLYLAARLGLRV